MIALQTDDLGVSYPDLLARVRREGSPVQLKDEKWIEARPLVLQLTDPRRCVVTRENFNEALMWLDVASVLSGTFDHDLYARVSASAARHLNEGGAYGPRVHDQLLEVKELLSHRPETRRGIVQLCGPGELDVPKPGGLPCTLSWQFLQRDGNLIMVNHMRANDMVWGLSYDVPTACCIGLAMAADLRLRFTEYLHLVGAACLYDRHEHLLVMDVPSRELPKVESNVSLVSSIWHARTALTSLREGSYTSPSPFWERAMTVWRRRLEQR